ncbi:MAG: thioredoxin family protein [Balneolaceae bacterium]|nr:thioredoxin family protein [Balneolaceae bacterium]
MTEVKTRCITRDIIENAYTYNEYRELIDELLKSGKTTGENHSESMLHYTKMNVHRMNRIDKRTKLSEEITNSLDNLNRPMVWLVITEAWCGDAAQSLPVIQMMAEQTKKIQSRYILRDEHLEIMDQFLTNGKSRSIPKLVALDARTLDVLGTWGPRPNEGQLFFDELRSNDELSYREVAERLHKWYADDRTKSIQSEFVPLLNRWENS